MNEDRVREIVREEIQANERFKNERMTKIMREFALEQIEKNAPSEDDGPLVSEIKGIFRETANDQLGRMEGCRSGQTERPAKALRDEGCAEGSNPSPSAPLRLPATFVILGFCLGVSIAGAQAIWHLSNRATLSIGLAASFVWPAVGLPLLAARKRTTK